MTRITNAMEHRIVVPGPAVSFRSPNAAAYRRRVGALARRVFPRRASSRPIDVFIDYFHTTRRRVDMDNVAKCVLDALNGIAYVDDRQVRNQRSQAHDLSAPLTLEAGPVDLIKPLETHLEYAFVRVREAPGRPRNRRRRLGA